MILCTRTGRTGGRHNVVEVPPEEKKPGVDSTTEAEEEEVAVLVLVVEAALELGDNGKYFFVGGMTIDVVVLAVDDGAPPKPVGALS